MVICFDCSERTKKALDKLLDIGGYTDYAEAVEIAVANQLALQEHARRSGGLLISPGSSLAPGEAGSRDSASRRGGASSRSAEQTRNPASAIPELFLRPDSDAAPSWLAPPPSMESEDGDSTPLNRWLLGQYNKVLPAKANCRALAHLLKGRDSGLPVEEVGVQIACQAAALRESLAWLDRHYGLGRDDALSTGFPSGGVDAEKSRLRYASHFVGSIDGQGHLSGLLVGLKLVNRSGDKDTCISLTEIGWDFAVLTNPILDRADDADSTCNGTERLTSVEREFLLNHIHRSVPTEDFAYRAILAAISSGANTPDHLDAALQKYIPEDVASALSKSFLCSQRSGAVSRMADLGLVRRIRDGLRVSYTITDFGRAFQAKPPEGTGGNRRG